MKAIAVSTREFVRVGAMLGVLLTSQAAATEASEWTLYAEAPGATATHARTLWLPDDSTLSIATGTDGRLSINVVPIDLHGEGGFSIALKRGPSMQLVPGEYEGTLIRNSSGAPGPYVYAKWDGDFACFASREPPLAGRFRVYEATYDSAGAIATLAVDFEMYCDGPTVPYIVGAFRYRSTRTSIVPFDGAYPVYRLTIEAAINGTVAAAGIDCGPGHSDCSEAFASPQDVTLIATPADGYRFVGWAGDCSGNATTLVSVRWAMTCSAVFNAVTPGALAEDPRLSASALLIETDPGGALDVPRRVALSAAMLPAGWLLGQTSIVTLPNGHEWFIDLRDPAHPNQQLTPGVYVGGVRIDTTMGQGCSTSGGRFTIYEVTVAPHPSFLTGQITSIAVDFEQTCAAGTIRGALRYRSTRSQLIPFDPAVPAPPPPPAPSSCTAADPFVSLGGGTCCNGGWLPPGMACAVGSGGSSGSSGSGGSTGSIGSGSTGAACTTPDPFASLGGGTCCNGGWLPPGMACSGGSGGSGGSSGSTSSTGCVGPDPFASIPTLVGVCINGGWVPVVR
jgi:List-Bact-rpt repeat protein